MQYSSNMASKVLLVATAILFLQTAHGYHHLISTRHHGQPPKPGCVWTCPNTPPPTATPSGPVTGTTEPTGPNSTVSEPTSSPIITTPTEPEQNSTSTTEPTITTVTSEPSDNSTTTTPSSVPNCPCQCTTPSGQVIWASRPAEGSSSRHHVAPHVKQLKQQVKKGVAHLQNKKHEEQRHYHQH